VVISSGSCRSSSIKRKASGLNYKKTGNRFNNLIWSAFEYLSWLALVLTLLGLMIIPRPGRLLLGAGQKKFSTARNKGR
jgi:hypothetical protein